MGLVHTCLLALGFQDNRIPYMFKHILQSIRMTHVETYQHTNCTHILDWVTTRYRFESENDSTRDSAACSIQTFCILPQNSPNLFVSPAPCAVPGTHLVLNKYNSFGWMHTQKRLCPGTACANTYDVFRPSWCYQRGPCEITLLLVALAQAENYCRGWWSFSIGLFSPKSWESVGQNHAVKYGRQCECLKEQVEAEF